MTLKYDERLEAEKMRRVPGIYFMENVGRRVPCVEGTGLQVFEIINEYLGFRRDMARLQDWFDTLSPAQLQAALDYCAAYQDEIDERLLEE